MLDKVRSGLIALLFGVGTQVEAFGCTPIAGNLPLPVTDPPLSFEEIARLQNISLKKVLGIRGPNDVVVYGTFSRQTDNPFYHEEIVKDLRAMYWRRNTDYELPYQTTFRYFGAYRFDGSIVNEGALEAFETDRLELELTLSAEYEGVFDLTPPEDVQVIGILRKEHTSSAFFKIDASTCDSYYAINSEELNSLLSCLADPDCM